MTTGGVSWTTTIIAWVQHALKFPRPSDPALTTLIYHPRFSIVAISVWPRRGHVVCRMYTCGTAVREPHSTRNTREGAAELDIFVVWHADRRVVARPQRGEGFDRS